MHKSKYIQKVEDYVIDLLCDLPESLCYHNLKHTQEVVEASRVLASSSKLSDVETEIVVISAWFHDAGHTTTYFGHEEAGVEIAKKFLNDINYPTPRIKEVLNCILATHYPPKPKNEIQKVLCDADMFHLTLDDYESRSMKLKEEIESVTDKEIPLRYWCDQNIEFLNDHCYFTSYGRKFLNFLKEKNLNKFFHNYCKNQ